ncbi:MAG: hypothetical protein V4537_05030 [Pseudomonadota bacterium]
MSQDARDSLNLWAGGIVFALLFWIALNFDLTRYFSRSIGDIWQNWIMPILLISYGLFLLGKLLRRLLVNRSKVNG